MVGMNDFAVPGRAEAVSSPPWPPSSAASCIQLSFCCRDDPLEDELEGAAVCRLQAAPSAASLSSSAVEMERMMSCGANFSVMLMKWTVTRATNCIRKDEVVTDVPTYPGAVGMSPQAHI
jgi:hypothetical protein